MGSWAGVVRWERGGCDGERGYLMRAVDGRQVGGEGGGGKKVARGVRGTPA